MEGDIRREIEGVARLAVFIAVEVEMDGTPCTDIAPTLVPRDLTDTTATERTGNGLAS